MKRKIMSWLLVLCMLLPCLPVVGMAAGESILSEDFGSYTAGEDLPLGTGKTFTKNNNSSNNYGFAVEALDGNNALKLTAGTAAAAEEGKFTTSRARLSTTDKIGADQYTVSMRVQMGADVRIFSVRMPGVQIPSAGLASGKPDMSGDYEFRFSTDMFLYVNRVTFENAAGDEVANDAGSGVESGTASMYLHNTGTYGGVSAGLNKTKYTVGSWYTVKIGVDKLTNTVTTSLFDATGAMLGYRKLNCASISNGTLDFDMFSASSKVSTATAYVDDIQVVSGVEEIADPIYFSDTFDTYTVDTKIPLSSTNLWKHYSGSKGTYTQNIVNEDGKTALVLTAQHADRGSSRSGVQTNTKFNGTYVIETNLKTDGGYITCIRLSGVDLGSDDYQLRIGTGYLYVMGNPSTAANKFKDMAGNVVSKLPGDTWYKVKIIVDGVNKQAVAEVYNEAGTELLATNTQGGLTVASTDIWLDHFCAAGNEVDSTWFDYFTVKPFDPAACSVTAATSANGSVSVTNAGGLGSTATVTLKADEGYACKYLLVGDQYVEVNGETATFTLGSWAAGGAEIKAVFRPVDELLFEDFRSYSVGDTISYGSTTSWTRANNNPYGGTITHLIQRDADKGNYLHLETTGSSETGTAGKTQDIRFQSTATLTGSYVVRADVKISGDSHYLAALNLINQAIGLRITKTSVYFSPGSNKIMTVAQTPAVFAPTLDTWYTYEIVVDKDAGTMTANVYDGETLLGTVTKTGVTVTDSKLKLEHYGAYLKAAEDKTTSSSFANVYAVPYVVTECQHTNTEAIPAVPATCTQPGSTAGVKCADCGEVITEPEAIPAAHTYGELVKATEAVHTATELKAAVAAHYFCDVCDTYFTENKEATTLEALTGEVPTHSYTVINGYVAADGHANKCECGAMDTLVGHIPNVDAATEETAKVCTVCEYVIEPKLDHVHNLTHVPAEAADCTEDGNIEYWTCTCGKYFKDAEAKTEITLADTVLPAGHTYGELVKATEAVHTATELKAAVAAHYFCDVCDTYFTENKEATTLEALTGEVPTHSYTVINGYVAADGHANKCECGAMDTLVAHIPNVDAATEETAKVCTVCEYVIEPKLDHVHNLTYVPAEAADCTEDGNIEYWTCTCGKYFKDAEAKTEIALADTVLPAGHDIVTHEGKPAAPGIAGYEAYETCTRCDYSTYTEIPALEIAADQQVTVDSFKEAGKAPVSQSGFFGGYYADADKTEVFEGTSGSAYVKFVSKNVLSVKYQFTAGTTAASESTDLRLVTTVDDLNYREIGFTIFFGDRQAKVSTRTVFSSIVANDGGVAFTETPKVFDAQSNYFMTYTITGVPASEFGTNVKVVPYWITLDGTVQEGLELNFRISDKI